MSGFLLTMIVLSMFRAGIKAHKAMLDECPGTSMIVLFQASLDAAIAMWAIYLLWGVK
jgi:hypothetical protein